MWLFMLALPTLLEMYFPWFVGLRPYALPIGIVMLIFGIAILIGQKKAGIRYSGFGIKLILKIMEV